MHMSFFDSLGVMLDCSRNAVMKPEAVKRMIDLLQKMGYRFLMLYTEDTYEVNNQPYFGHLRGRYSKAEMKELAAYAQNHGVELIPCVQTLAHLNALMHWPQYAEMKDCHDILCAGEESVYTLLEDVFSTLHECFLSRTVNIGMDEAEFIGLGNYFKKHGIEDRVEILLNHLNRVAEIASKYGFELLMWGDMFYKLCGDTADSAVYERVKAAIPQNVHLIYWDYASTEKEHYDKHFKIYKKMQDELWFAGGIWTWTGFAPHLSFSQKAIHAAFESCKENGVKRGILTVWGDDGAECSRFSTLPVLYWFSILARGVTDMRQIRDGFYELCHIDFDDFFLLELPGTPNMDGNYTNPDKYLTYNDCFLGSLDSTVCGDERARYLACAEKLEKHKGHPEYGILFDSLHKLCLLLAEKADIGVVTRRAYQAGDREALLKIPNRLDLLLKRYEDFYTAYERQWMWENKPHGFDVMDIRLGGAMQRIRHCKARLLRWLSGELAELEELKEPMLEVNCGLTEPGRAITYTLWSYSATVNSLSHPVF